MRLTSDTEQIKGITFELTIEIMVIHKLSKYLLRLVSLKQGFSASFVIVF